MAISFPDLSQSYLTPSQQLGYNRISKTLQLFIQKRALISGNPQDASIGRLILDISKYGNPELQEVSEQFFVELLESKQDIVPYLKKLLGICEKGGFTTFFHFVSTKKVHYYSIETLLEAIVSFEEVFAKQPLILSKLPCYDEGGKERLDQLKVTLNAGKSSTEVSSFADLFFKKAAALHFLQVHYSLSFDFLNNFNRNTREAFIGLIVGAIRQLRKEDLSKEDLEEFIRETLLFYKKWGEDEFLLFCLSPNSELQSFDKIVRYFTLLNILIEDAALVHPISANLRQFRRGEIPLAKSVEQLEKLVPEFNPNTRESIESLLLRFQGKDPNVLFPLPDQHLKTIERQHGVIESYCEQWKKLRFGQLIQRAHSIRAGGEYAEEKILQLIAIGRLAIYRIFKVYLHNTQIFTVLGQLCQENGSIAQVKTGEGKSLIISLLAFVLAMQNKSVHIISSSHNLAIRDQKNAAAFFRPFGITTSHISTEGAEESRFQAQILYGTVSDFEFAVMREMLYFTPLFEQKANSFEGKRFDCAIVDELDNLTIDTALNQARLSYPTETTYQWVYASILAFVIRAKEEQREIFSPLVIKELRQVLQECAGGHFREIVATIPTNQLMQWLRSAQRALLREENKDYVVLKTQSGLRRKPQEIVVVDAKNTGRLMRGSRWSGGVHEFVEAKHHIVSEKESLMPISLSHFLFYPLYRSLFGLTGTLGGSLEREELKEFYGTSSFDVPPHCPMVREDMPPKIFVSKEPYWQTILDRVEMCRSQGRPILVLCETIHDSQEIEGVLKKAEIPLEMLNEVQEKREELILEKAGWPGAVTIATNTASRGTDIKLTKASQDQGGLHVLLTFFPESKRVEDQARGRAGRQGEKGSSEIVVFLERAEGVHSKDIDLPDVQAELLQPLEEKRMALARIMKHSHSCRAELERYSFSFVKSFFSHFQEFHRLLQDEDCVKKCAMTLSGRKIKETEVDFSQLQPKDRVLALQARELLTGKVHEPRRWEGILRQAGKRIKENMIAHWSIHVYQEIEELLQSSHLENYAVISERLQQITDQMIEMEESVQVMKRFFQELEASIVQEKIEILDQLKRKIKDLYDQNKAEWEKYLDPSGNGILCYLGEITQVALTSSSQEVKKQLLSA